MKKIWFILILTIVSIESNAVTITPVGGDESLISGLEVQGITYDGWFGWTAPEILTNPDQFPFIGNQTAAEDAANQIAQALTTGGYNSVDRAWLNYFFIPFEDPFVDIIGAYKGKFYSSNGGEWLVTLETTSSANSWVLLTPVPIPPPFFLLGSALLGLVGLFSHKKIQSVSA